MDIGAKVQEIFSPQKAKKAAAVGALGLALTLSGCATQGNTGLEFSFLNGKIGHRGQYKWGKNAPQMEQDIYHAQAQVQPYAVKAYTEYPQGMMDAYQAKPSE